MAYFFGFIVVCTMIGFFVYYWKDFRALTRKATCDICGEGTGGTNESRTIVVADGQVCQACIEKAFLHMEKSVNGYKRYKLEGLVSRIQHRQEIGDEALKKEIEENKISALITEPVVYFELINRHKAPKFVRNFVSEMAKMTQRKDGSVYFEKEDVEFFRIVSFNWEGPKYEERSETITQTTSKKSGLGRAVVGGVLAGPAGAIVGGMTGKSKGEATSTTRFYQEEVASPGILVLKDIETSAEHQLEMSIKQRTASVIQEMHKLSQKQELPKTNPDAIVNNDLDEIRKYKQLVDEGIITESEFEKKKKQILGI